MNQAVRPQDDFFNYVNSEWLAANPIPPSESTWGTFYVLRDQAADATHDILNKLVAADEALLDHDQTLLRRLYQSALSFDNQTEAHTNFLQKELTRIDEVTTADKLASYLGDAHRRGYSPFWTSYVGLDDKDSSVEVLRLYQAGLGLPNRDYYLDDSERMQEIRAKYEQFYSDVQQALPEVFENQWTEAAQTEKWLAETSWTDVELRDVQKNYSRVPLSELKQRLGTFNWGEYFAALGWDQPSDNFVIDQYSYAEKCVNYLATTPLERIRPYLKWHVVRRSLGWFNEALSALNFSFYGTVISGVEEQKPLWKRAALLIDSLPVGEALGREYARQHFPESSKQAVLKLVEEIRAAYHIRIDRLTWMTPNTKKRAHTKLDAMKVFVGYPSVWKDFSGLEFSDDILENLVRAYESESAFELAKVGRPPAAEEWEMNAHTVNAYHHPNRLEIVFPAAILQAPFFDAQGSHAANLGGIGAVIGHELTHGFDDQGSEFDEHGTSNPWQTTEERAAFDDLADNIVRLADAFETTPGTYLQGRLILGEAIADIGGLALAVEALEASEPNATKRSELLKELFENFASCECGHATEERLVQLAKTDPHPPSPFRVNCVVNHIDAFYDTYGVTPTDKLYLPPNEWAQIW